MAVLHTLILAAGESRRFESCKQLASVGKETLLERVLMQAHVLTPGATTLVLGARAELIERQCHELIKETKVALHNHEGWREGMGSSLAAGIHALPSDVEAVLVLVVDQVSVTVKELGNIIDRWRQLDQATRERKIVCARYRQTVGVPALFPSRYFDELKQLYGDRGAKKLISRYASDTLTVSMPSASIDIDTQDQLQSFGENNDNTQH